MLISMKPSIKSRGPGTLLAIMNVSSAAFFELFSSEIMFVCLISCQGIILCYSAQGNSSKGKGYGP